MNSATLSILDMKRRLASLLLEKSYREGHFVLASGRESDFYFDGRQTALHPEGAWLIGNLFYDLLSDLPQLDAVGGMTLGADPLVTATSVISWTRNALWPPSSSGKPKRTRHQSVYRGTGKSEAQRARGHAGRRGDNGRLPADGL